MSIVALLSLGVLATIYGCDSPNIIPQPIVTPTLLPIPTRTSINPDAVQLLKRAVEVTDRLQSYHYINMANPVINGDFLAPDMCRFETENEGAPIVVIQKADRFYEQQPNDNLFTEFVEPSNGPMCDGGFLGELHIEISGVTSAKILGEELFEGHKVTHLNFTYDPGVFGPFPVGVHSFEDTSGTDVWIEKDTNYVLKLMPSVFEPEFCIDYSRFNEQVTPSIEEPSPDKVTKIVNIGESTPKPWPTTVLP